MGEKFGEDLAKREFGKEVISVEYPRGEDKHLYGTDDERRIKRPHLPGISLIAWVNDQDQFANLVIRTLTSVYQIAEFDLQVIQILPEAGCVNMGQAYNLGRQAARFPTKLYIHQDAQPIDRHFVEKLHRLLDAPYVGAVGLVGCVNDTGGAYFEAPLNQRRGQYWGTFYHERAKVAIVDGMLLATREDVPWSEEYETTHMFVEDYCMRVRETGKEIWTINSQIWHFSPGIPDDRYYRSAETFRRNWAHRLPAGLPDLKEIAAQGHLIKHYEVKINLQTISCLPKMGQPAPEVPDPETLPVKHVKVEGWGLGSAGSVSDAGFDGPDGPAGEPEEQ